MDCSPPGSSVHGILHARTLEWVTSPPPGDLPNQGTEPVSPALQVDSSLLSQQGRLWNDILWFWLAFCWWLVILNIFCSSFVCLLLKPVYPEPLVIFKLLYLFFYCLVIVLYIFSIKVSYQIHDWQIFFSLCGLPFHFFKNWFLIGGLLLFCIVLVSIIERCESAINIQCPLTS